MSEKSTTQEVCEPAFHDYEKPLIAYGLPFSKSCRKHAEETFSASRISTIASASLARDTTWLIDLRKKLGDKVVYTRVGMSQHTLIRECLEVSRRVLEVDTDLIVT
jgi:hypothetical protein